MSILHEGFSVFVSRQPDWSLHRRGQIDQARHKEKIMDAIRANLPEIISEEGIITADDGKIVKVPIRSLELPKFRFNQDRLDRIGQGTGDSKVGDVIGQKSDAGGAGRGKGAGNEPGIDWYEAEITVDELLALAFEDLGLPNLKPKAHHELESPDVRFKEVSKRGVMSNLDKRRSALEAIKRNRMAGGPGKFRGLREEDMRFRIWTQDVKKESNAVVIAMRDVSASMGEFEKYISRSFYAWMVRFLKTKYKGVQVAFITHHTEAKEVDEDVFFRLGESGGTRVSSAYELALKMINERFDPNRWNIYAVHFSDGDNWGEKDNKRCLELVKKLLEMCNNFGYGEIRQDHSPSQLSTLMGIFAAIKDEKFAPMTIGDRKDVWPALKKIFPGESFAEGSRRI